MSRDTSLFKKHKKQTTHSFIKSQHEEYKQKKIEYYGVSITRAKWQKVTDKVGHQGYENVQQLLNISGLSKGQLEKLLRAAGEKRIHFECSPNRHSQLANRLQTERISKEKLEIAAKEAATKETQRLKDIETARIAKEKLEIAAKEAAVKETQRLKDIETARIAQEKEDEEETFSIPSSLKTEEIIIDIMGDPNNPLVDYEVSY